jgi:Leucine-rich repeat (LRR) protein
MLTNLRSVDLHDNSINAIPPEIGNLIKLGDLNLSNNPIPKKEREAIKRQLPKCEIIF